jgi:hypothetical protein
MFLPKTKGRIMNLIGGFLKVRIVYFYLTEKPSLGFSLFNNAQRVSYAVINQFPLKVCSCTTSFKIGINSMYTSCMVCTSLTIERPCHFIRSFLDSYIIGSNIIPLYELVNKTGTIIVNSTAKEATKYLYSTPSAAQRAL